MTQYEVYKQPDIVDFLRVCSRLPADEIEQFEIFTGETFDAPRVAATFYLRPGPSWVMLVDKEPIVIAGFDQIRPGVWQDWMFSTPDAWSEAHWKAVTKRSKRVMDSMLRSGAHRLQCVSLASRVQAHRWYRVLGLELEGTLRAYGVGGENAFMFSRLRQE